MSDIFIKPIGILPMPTPIFPIPISNEIVKVFALCFSLSMIGLCLSMILYKYAKTRWQLDYKLNFILPMLISVLLYVKFGLSMEYIKGIILMTTLIFASNSDIKSHEVSNYIPIIILTVALIDISLADVPIMLISAVLVAIPQLIAATSKKGSYGGADIKIMTACTFLLGISKGLAAIIIGLSLAIIFTVIIRKIKKQDIKQAIPLVPYLSIGVMLAYFI